ncbi:leucyl aminopeptidase [soil metagenome]
MTAPVLQISSAAAGSISADLLVIGVGSGDDGPVLHSDDPAFSELSGSLSTIGVTGATDEVRRIPGIAGIAASAIALVGLGGAEPDSNGLRLAAGSAARQLTGVESLVIALPVTTAEQSLAVLEGAGIGAYAYTAYRSSSLEKTKLPASTITVVSPVADETPLEKAAVVVAAIHEVRDLVNTPPSDLYPETLAAAAAGLASGLPIEVTILAEEELRAGGFGGILGVGQGSTRGPRLVKLAYSPTGATRHLALVGKGITFDTGGLSLKPAAGMVGMKYDMTGAATVLAVVAAAARLAIPLRITAWMCIAENMPSGSATRPNDVLRMRGGTTVEVLNTDAEGRLVLADGLAAASEEHPDAIVDVATLTGAARVALGDRYVAAMGDEELVGRVTELASAAGESVWPMPLPAELRTALNSDIADIANARMGNTAGGMLLAGHFLREFVGTVEGDSGARIPWVHLDIAGPANNSSGGYGYTPKGPTGVTVRTLLALAEDFATE